MLDELSFKLQRKVKRRRGASSSSSLSSSDSSDSDSALVATASRPCAVGETRFGRRQRAHRRQCAAEDLPDAALPDPIQRVRESQHLARKTVVTGGPLRTLLGLWPLCDLSDAVPASRFQRS